MTVWLALSLVVVTLVVARKVHSCPSCGSLRATVSKKFDGGNEISPECMRFILSCPACHHVYVREDWLDGIFTKKGEWHQAA